MYSMTMSLTLVSSSKSDVTDLMDFYFHIVIVVHIIKKC